MFILLLLSFLKMHTIHQLSIYIFRSTQYCGGRIWISFTTRISKTHTSPFHRKEERPHDLLCPIKYEAFTSDTHKSFNCCSLILQSTLLWGKHVLIWSKHLRGVRTAALNRSPGPATDLPCMRSKLCWIMLLRFGDLPQHHLAYPD